MKKLDIDILTQTPLWTGNAEGKMSRIQETSLLGSMRWWCEVFVRGVGGHAPDPILNPQTLKDDAFKAQGRKTDRESLLRAEFKDDVAHLFGATGWRRRFRLTAFGPRQSTQKLAFITDHPRRDGSIKIEIPRPPDKQGKAPAWYLNSTPKKGEVRLSLISTGNYDNQKFDLNIIAGLLSLMSKKGGIGAKNQLGMGVFSPLTPIDTTPFLDWLATLQSDQQPDVNLPAIQNLFFADITQPNLREDETFHLKYNLRDQFRLNRGNTQEMKNLRHFVMGMAIRDKKIASKVNISLPFKTMTGTQKMRVWGWLPTQAGEYGTYDRAWVRTKIKRYLEERYDHVAWCDMEETKHNDPLQFIRTLAEDEG